MCAPNRPAKLHFLGYQKIKLRIPPRVEFQTGKPRRPASGKNERRKHWSYRSRNNTKAVLINGGMALLVAAGANNLTEGDGF